MGSGAKNCTIPPWSARRGEIVFRARKQLLPSYDVFDETRYFEPGPPSGPLPGRRPEPWRDHLRRCLDHEIGEYHVAPVDELFAAAGAAGTTIDALINISASPFQRGKERTAGNRSSRRSAAPIGVPFLYANQVGGQDSLLFDGRSLALDGSGETVAQAPVLPRICWSSTAPTWQGEMHAPAEVGRDWSVYDGLVMGVARLCPQMRLFLGRSSGSPAASIPP